MVDFNNIIKIAGGVATQAGALGLLPGGGLIGAVVNATEDLITQIGEQTGKTREQILDETHVQNAANLIDLQKLKDME